MTAWHSQISVPRHGPQEKGMEMGLSTLCETNYINPGYGLSLVDTLWNASSYRQPLEQEGNPMT